MKKIIKIIIAYLIIMAVFIAGLTIGFYRGVKVSRFTIVNKPVSFKQIIHDSK